MLNNLKIQVFLNNDKLTRLKDENGLVLVKQKKANKWYARFRHAGVIYQKELGTYPQLSLSDARIKLRVLKSSIIENPTITVRQAATLWMKKKQQEIIDFKKLTYRVEKYIISPFGGIDLDKLTAPMVIEAWSSAAQDGKIYTLKAMSNYLADIATMMINIGRVKNVHNIFHISDYYVRPPAEQRPTIDPDHLSDFFTAYFNKKQNYTVAYDLMLLTFYTLLRQQEITYLQWDWIKPTHIEIPAEVMKMKRPHRVPLTNQIKEILNNIPAVSKYIFPSPFKNKQGKTINKETLNCSFKKLGFQNILCAHGIRSIGSTWLAKQNFKKEFREACLAHKTGGQVELSYQNYDFIRERTLIMQEWCNFVEKALKEGQARAKQGEIITDLKALKNPLVESVGDLTLESLKIR